VEEVLKQQPSTVREFLLKTSILERMAAPLCDAVLGGPATGLDGEPGEPSPLDKLPTPPAFSSQEILERLEAANLFIVPLDEQRGWYRYHALFADLLRYRLGQALPEQVAGLHRRASRWWAANGQVFEALGHALAAGEVEWAARLAEENALTLRDRGQLATLETWIKALPVETVRSHLAGCGAGLALRLPGGNPPDTRRAGAGAGWIGQPAGRVSKTEPGRPHGGHPRL
jgi:LuxR family maltose regulon positive regulatory protein